MQRSKRMQSKQRQLNNTGIYLRLSKDDERAGESLSIDNQRLILQKYVAERGWNLVDEYVDDGFSGTDFERPQVKRLLDDAKTGRINTIVVKDLSRFGRNYIMVGQYLDYIFPAYGIRFIAINDNVDTADRNSTGMDMMPIMNVFNEWHSANTSKKIRAVLEASQKAGKYTSGCYPYGYLVGDDENRTAIIDEPAAEVVRRIYDMRIQGLSPYRIARVLSDEGIPNPTLYRTKKDGSKINRRAPNWWSHKTVREMLADPTYKGCTVQHRRSTISYKNHNTYWLPQDEWIVKQNAHEPIVSEEVWEKAQEVARSVSRSKRTSSGVTHPLSGFIYCADCGHKMKIVHSKKKQPDGKEYDCECYICRTYANLGKNYCTTHAIQRKDIEEIVLANIRAKCDFVLKDEEAAREEFLKSKSKRSATARNCDTKQLNAKRKRMEELDVLIRTAFEEKVLKKMPENLCNSLCESYQKEQQKLQTEITALEMKLQDESKDEADVEEYIRRIKLYGNCPELTREMCLQLIEFITIDAKTEHNNRWHPPAPRNIHIYYKLIDKEHAKPREN